MAELVYSTESRLTGPWLIDAGELERLDDIITSEWERLQHRREEVIEREAEDAANKWPGRIGREVTAEELNQHKEEYIRERREDKYPPCGKEIRILLTKGRSVLVDSFRAALREQSLVDEIPVGFQVDLVCEKIACAVSLKNEALSISTAPESSREAREAFVALRQWAISNQAPAWQRFWLRLSGFGLQWLVWAVIAFTIGSAALSASVDTYQTQNAKSRARTLLDSGITEAQVPEALEVLLILAAEYDPDLPASPSIVALLPKWYKAIFLGTSLVAVILSIRPRTILGIGNGTRRIQLWRRWLKLIGVTIPTLLFGSFVWPYIEQLLRRLLF